MRLVLSIVSLLVCAAAPVARAQRDAGPDAGERAEQGREVILVPPVDTRGGDKGDLVSPEERHADADRALREAGFVTVVRVDERAGETATMAEVLGETVGAHVRSLGGLGSFSSLSVRGASPGHTAVVVDGVPLARLGAASADLGRFEPSSFSLVALHRGAIPVGLGGAAQSSALELTTAVGPPADGHPLLFSAGAGSFGARHLRGRYLGGRADGSLGYHLGLGYDGAEGDLEYFDDNGTNLNRSDDGFETRSNNGYDQVDAVGRFGLSAGAWSLAGGARSGWKDQGVPGSASVQSSTASLTTWSQMADASATRGGAFGRRELTGRVAGFALVELQRYRDRDGEVGLGAQDRRYLTASFGGRGGLDAALGRHLASAGVEAGLDLFTDRDLDEGGSRTRGRRWLGAVTAADAIQLAGERVRLVPAVRIDLMRTEPVGDPSAGIPDEMPAAARNDAFLSPRASLLARLTPDLSAKLDGGRYLRAPTALELFGDRGFVVGNPDLEAETGESADLGLVLAPAAPAGPVDRLYLEAVAFASRSRDTIVLVPTAALVAAAQNLGGARVWGGELVASARAARAVTLTGNYTFMKSRQEDTLPSYEGKELPQRPRHRLYGRLDLAQRIAGRLAALWTDASLVSGNLLDPANLDRVPDRALFGAGLMVELGAGLSAALDGKNLADQRVEDIPLDPPPRPDLTSAPAAVSDFFGYPLPGRAFYLTLQWEP
jgi:iron complex outermembrane receptor protein